MPQNKKAKPKDPKERRATKETGRNND